MHVLYVTVDIYGSHNIIQTTNNHYIRKGIGNCQQHLNTALKPCLLESSNRATFFVMADCATCIIQHLQTYHSYVTQQN